MISRTNGDRRHVSMTAIKKEKPAVESEELPRGTELGIATALSHRRIEPRIVQGISLAGRGSSPDGLSGHQDVAVFRPPSRGLTRRHATHARLLDEGVC